MWYVRRETWFNPFQFLHPISFFDLVYIATNKSQVQTHDTYLSMEIGISNDVRFNIGICFHIHNESIHALEFFNHFMWFIIMNIYEKKVVYTNIEHRNRHIMAQGEMWIVKFKYCETHFADVYWNCGPIKSRRDVDIHACIMST